jgi:8-oxo-dGTP diphosphatase
MGSVKRKAFAYITYQMQLLVFSHPDFPEAGIQVPAGTIEEAEAPAQAALREAFEETGLTNLALEGFLGEQIRDMADFSRDEVHHRYFYHLRCCDRPPSRWRYEEHYPSDGPAHEPVLFEFFWVPLSGGVPALIADHGMMLPQLLNQLAHQSG